MNYVHKALQELIDTTDVRLTTDDDIQYLEPFQDYLLQHKRIVYFLDWSDIPDVKN